MVLRQVGGLLHALAANGGFVRDVQCEARKVEVSQKGSVNDKKSEKKKYDKERCNKIPDWSKEWSEEVEWVGLEDGIKFSRSHFKPLLVIVEKRDCPKCEILRSQISLSEEFAEASKDFVMVVVAQSDLDPKDEKFRPDGEYVPRALFFHPDGPFLARYTNEFLKSPNKYFYRSPRNLVRVMTKAKFHFLDPN